MENTIVRGNSEIYSDGILELTNCELNETKIKQKDQQIDTKCSNTSFKNEVTLSRVESVNRSVLNNSHISSASNESIKVDGENLKDVSNYEEYLNEKYAQTTFVDLSSKSSLEAL